MYLKRLELLGFKSFAQKTTLEFSSGVTAIVGPNGSGKSNVTDALRWVLGETSAKSIRAERAENLIFSGTAKRTQAGFAQVTMTLDNSTGFYPMDYAEINVRRRVGRDGTSSYYLNDSEVRLKDIVDFFASARLGTKGFAIINQGSSDMFIRANIIERRVMLEEVLGLRQYQIKRRDAENKLDNTKRNLVEANSRAEEILPHLRVLRRQAKKWARHDEIKERLTDLEGQYFGFKLYELEKERDTVTPDLTKFDAQIMELNKELDDKKAKLNQVEKSQPKPDKNFDNFRKKQATIQSQKTSLQKDLARLEVELEFLAGRSSKGVSEDELMNIIKQIRALISRSSSFSDIEALKEELKKLDSHIERKLSGESKETEDRKATLAGKIKAVASELEVLETQFSEINKHEDKVTDALRSFNDDFKTAYQAVEEKRAQVAKIEAKKNNLKFAQDRVEIRMSDLTHQANQVGKNILDFKPVKEIKNDKSISEVENLMLRARGELASIGDIDPAMLEEAKEMEERYEFLSNQIKDLESATSDLEKLINELKKKVFNEFGSALEKVNEELNKHFQLMFGGGKARLIIIKKANTLINGEGDTSYIENKDVDEFGLEIELSLPRKNIRSLDMLSGGERSLVSIAVLFALISVSPPPFLVLDEIDAALDEANTKRFSNLIKEFSKKSQFVVVTHNRATMHGADVLYGVTMNTDGTSRLLSVKFEAATEIVKKP